MQQKEEKREIMFANLSRALSLMTREILSFLKRSKKLTVITHRKTAECKTALTSSIITPHK